MGKYGEAAVKAVKLLGSGKVESPREAWEKVTIEIFGGKTSGQRKGCPRDAFLGLCEEGLVKGIPAANYTKSKKNKGYAIKAVQILKEKPELAYDQNELWIKVLEKADKVHNQQMDVVTALWNSKLLVTNI